MPIQVKCTHMLCAACNMHIFVHALRVLEARAALLEVWMQARAMHVQYPV